MTVVTTNGLIDEVLARYEVPGNYRNHVYRGLNYQLKLLGLEEVPNDIALAWALHDIGLFTAGWDYLGPSVRLVDQLAGDYGIDNVARVRQMVELHHKLRPCRDTWVESFRVADRIDVSGGLLSGGLARSAIKDVVAAHPYAGFHGFLARTAVRWAVRHPLRPMPMMRW